MKLSHKKKWIFLLFIFILFLSGFFGFSWYFSIKEVLVDGYKDINGLALIKNKNIIFFDTKKYEDILFQTNTNISTISIIKSYPSTLRINVEQASATAILPVGNGNFVLSKEGRILAKERNDSTHLPHINYYQKIPFQGYESGDIVNNSDILFSLKLLERLAYLGIASDSIDINGLDMIVLKKGTIEYVFTTERNIQEQYENLKIIVEKFKIDGKQYKRIDLRFDKPIIKI